MRTPALVFAAVMLAVVGVTFLCRGALETVLTTPLSGDGGASRLVVIPHGTDAPALIDQLQQEGLVAGHELLDVYAKYLHEAGALVPGEYRLGPGMSPVQLIKRVERGQVYEHTVTLPAGSTVEEVAQILAKQELVDPQAFLRAAYDAELARRLGIEGPSVEGFLYPDVWALPRGLAPEGLIERMVQRFFREAPGLEEASSRLGLTRYELVTLASLVQRGPIRSSERRLYAALLIERLQKGLALESAAADAYAASRDPSDGRRNPWNTSQRPGLPQTPIGSPSRAALRATLDPADTEPVYMVRRKNGRHVYCPDTRCYVRALAKHHPGKRPHFPKRFSRPGSGSR